VQYDRAERILLRAVDLARRSGERYMIGSCLPKLGNLYLEHGNHAAAGPLYREALAAFREIREGWWTGRCMQFLALAARGRRNHLLAALLIGCSDAVLEANGARRNPRELTDRANLLDSLREALGQATYTDTYERGRQFSVESMLNLIFDVPSGTGER